MDNPKKTFRPGAGRGNSGRRGFRNAGFIALLILFGLIIFAAYGQSGGLRTISLTQAVADANSGVYGKIEVSGNEMDITVKGDKQATLKAYKDPNASLKDEGINTNKVEVSYKPQSSTGSTVIAVGESLLPVLVI